MFGSKPKRKDLTGHPEDDKLYGRYGKMIEDKLTALERKLTKQILCKHKSYSIKERAFSPILGGLPISFDYWKTCDDCGIDMGPSSAYEKEQREYEIAKQKVEKFEKSQPKETDELPVETTEFRGDFSTIRNHGRLNKVRFILRDALDKKEAIDSGEQGGTQVDCHNILFKAVDLALLELSKD